MFRLPMYRLANLHSQKRLSLMCCIISALTYAAFSSLLVSVQEYLHTLMWCVHPSFYRFETFRQNMEEEEQSVGHYLVFVRLDVRTYLRMHPQIFKSENYFLNLGIKYDIELYWKYLTSIWYPYVVLTGSEIGTYIHKSGVPVYLQTIHICLYTIHQSVGTM